MANPDPIKYSDLISYDDSIEKLISELNEVISVYDKLKKDVMASASEAAKAMQGLSGATDEQRQAIAQNAQRAEELSQKYRRLTEEEVQLKAAQQDIVAANREAIKMARLQKEAAEAAEGSYKRLSAQYRINKEQLNKMTKADREGTDAGKKLEEQTRKIYEEMSRLQKATGKYTLEVGHYENALKGLPGILGKFGGGLSMAGQQAEKAKESVAALAGGLGMSTGGLVATLGVAAATISAVIGAFNVWKNSIHTTQAVGDEFDKAVASWNGSWAVFQKSISTFDFTNFISGAIDAGRAAAQLRGILDQSFERENSIRLQKAALAEENAILLESLRNQKLTVTERLEAGREYIERIRPIYEQEIALSKDIMDAQLDYIFSVTNRRKDMTDEERESAKQQLANFVTEYNVNLDRIKAANELIKAEDELREIQTGRATQYSTDLEYWQEVRTRLQGVVESADEDTKAIARVVRQYQLTNDEEVKGFIEASVRYRNARAAMGNEQRRVTTQINTLEAQLLKDQTKATEEREMLAERERLARESVTNDIQSDVEARADLLRQSIANEEDAASVIAGVQNKLSGEIKQAGIKRRNSVNDYYKDIKDIYADNEKEIAEETIRNMIASENERAALLSIAAESGVEEVWNAVGAKSAEEAKQMAEDAKTNATNIVLAANKAMKDTGAGLSWRFYSPAQGWSAINPEPEAGTTPAGGTNNNQNNRPRSGGSWSLQGDRKYQEARLALLREFEDGEYASREELDKKLDELEIATLEKRLSGLRKGSSEAIKIESELIERRAKASEKAAADAKKVDDEAVKAGVEYLNHQKETIQLEIAATEKGTTQMLMLRLELIEKEREIELKLNREKSEEMRQDEALINAKYDRMRLDTVEDNAKKMAEAAKKGASNGDSKSKGGKEKAQDLFDVFGIHLGGKNEDKSVLDERKEALTGAIDTVKESVSSLIDTWREEAHAAVEAADAQVDSAQKVLDAEREAAAQGYAANVARAQAELELAKKNREDALKEEQKAQKAQLAIDSITQASSLVTASANIWSSLSGIPMVGPALAVAALALMWGSFAASKIKAAQVAKETYGEGTVELLKGGSHASGNDIYLGMTDDGKERRAEGGEYFAVINKRNSRKFGAVIPDVINSFNDGTFADKYMRSGEAMKGYAVQMMVGADLAKVEDGIEAIRKQGEESRTTEGGYTVIRYKNLTRRVKS